MPWTIRDFGARRPDLLNRVRPLPFGFALWKRPPVLFFVWGWEWFYVFNRFCGPLTGSVPLVPSPSTWLGFALGAPSEFC